VLASDCHLSKSAVNVVLALVLSSGWFSHNLALVISFAPRVALGQSGGDRAHGSSSTLPWQLRHDPFPGVSPRAACWTLSSLRVEITIPATILVALFRVWRPTARVSASGAVETRSLGDRGVMVVPRQVALISVVQFYRELGNLFGLNPYGRSRVIIFHVRLLVCRLGIFLMRKLSFPASQGPP